MSRITRNEGLRRLLEGKEVSIKDLAAFGVNRFTLHKYQQGAYLPGVEARLCAAFDLTPRSLRRRLFPTGVRS
jgi:hypothetical protein